MQHLDFSIAIYADKLRFLRKMTNVGFARIDHAENPIDLFKIWRAEAIKFKIKVVNACCVATIRSE